MRLERSDLIGYAAGAALVSAYLLLPRPWGALVLWVAVGAFVLYVIVEVVRASWRVHRIASLPPPAPMPCPACGHTEHEYKSQGLWDGHDMSGKSVGGSFGFGLCRRCGSRWAQWDDDPPYVPSEEEWEREVAGPEKRRGRQLWEWTGGREGAP